MRFLLIMTFLLLLVFGEPVQLHAEPAYAKWGALAVQEAKKKYDADVS